ncbi:Aste57867_21026 [Aphanomyces stellatus]|uniref:Aste57867_21026 protein n=1 Tax=Aphanomyces stellatus TaxID=120398 RepID=A0A485LH23_9STRA|nr:hypothetical protein As57867_020958 [Aphanomyces stellatus]VFT97701.1 Aste57867_21026 [Aphanomyces stellatus]
MTHLDVYIDELLLNGLLDQASCGSLSDDSLECDADLATTDCSGLDDLWIGAPVVKHEVNDSLDKTTKYLEKLYCMLEGCPESIAAWTQNGASFAIYDSDALEKNVIPRFFKPIKFESFSRQLNSYGFRKTKLVVADKIVFEFKHANFVRGKSDQLLTIKRRRRVKRNGVKTVDDMNDEELRGAMKDLMGFVQSLQHELSETKALVRSLAESSGDSKPIFVAV